MKTSDGLTVGRVARLSGLTVRTLHHYDEIGLVVPRLRSDSGYRLYGDAEVARLQEVLFFRELGFGLDEIKSILEGPDHDRGAVLRRQRALLQAKATRVQRMIEALDAALAMEEGGTRMTKEEMLEVFGDFDPAEYEEEVKERWGDSEAFQESARRTSSYRKQDWQRLRDEAAAINRGFVELMSRGVPAAAPEAMDLASRHREHISRWFYDCPPEMHAALGRMYVEDPRFTANIDREAPGLAAYMSEAFEANARR